MNASSNHSDSWQVRVKKNTRRLAVWTIAWVLTTALVAFGPKFIWDFSMSLSVVAVVINLVIGFGMILATISHLKTLDELAQKVFLDASAFTLGVIVVCGGAYELLEDIKIIAFQPEISHLIIFSALTFMMAMLIGNRRYQ